MKDIWNKSNNYTEFRDTEHKRCQHLTQPGRTPNQLLITLSQTHTIFSLGEMLELTYCTE